MARLALHAVRWSGDYIAGYRLILVHQKLIHSSGWNILGQEKKLASVQDVSETVSYEEEISHNGNDDNMEKRKKSRLAPQHRNIVYGVPPYKEPITPYHSTIEYRRKMFGRYGMASGVDPGLLWPTNEELRDKIEYERIAYPDTLHDMIARAKIKLEREQEAIKRREEEINDKAEKLEQWKHELQQRIRKKEKEAQAAKVKKERLLEEVRQHFGFKVDPRDQRFKDLLEQKEKEESKRAKAEKKKLKQAKMLAKLTGPSPSTTMIADSPPSSGKVD